MRRQILHEFKMGLLAAGIGAAVFASFLFFGMRAKAATIRDGVHSPVYEALQTIDRQELAEMLDINEVTLYRKLKRGGDFTREEINIMIDRLGICDPVEIFFAEVLE